MLLGLIYQLLAEFGAFIDQGRLYFHHGGGYYTLDGHVTREGAEGYYTPKGHVTPNGAGEYFTPKGQIISDGAGGYSIPDECLTPPEGGKDGRGVFPSW